MDVIESRSGNFLILEPVGHLDSRTSSEFEKRIAAHLKAGEKRFIIDLVSTEYMSSAGLRVLLMFAKKCDAMDGELILCSLNESVRDVFDIAGFHVVFTIAADRVAAVSGAEKRPKVMRIFNLAARLLAIRKPSGEEAEPLDDRMAHLVRRAEELLAIAEERDKLASTVRSGRFRSHSGRSRSG